MMGHSPQAEDLKSMEALLFPSLADPSKYGGGDSQTPLSQRDTIHNFCVPCSFVQELILGFDGGGFTIDPPLDFGPCSRVSAFLVSLLCSSPCSLYLCPTDSGNSRWPTVEFCLESSEGHPCLFKTSPLGHGWKLSPGRLLGNLRPHCRRSLCLMDCILALLGAHC